MWTWLATQDDEDDLSTPDEHDEATRALVAPNLSPEVREIDALEKERLAVAKLRAENEARRFKIPWLEVGVGALALAAVLREKKEEKKMPSKGEKTVEREVIFLSAMRTLEDPADLRRLGDKFAEQGLTAPRYTGHDDWAAMLRARADYLELPFDTRRQRRDALRKGLRSTNKQGVYKLAAMFRDAGAWVSAEELEKHAAGLPDVPIAPAATVAGETRAERGDFRHNTDITEIATDGPGGRYGSALANERGDQIGTTPIFGGFTFTPPEAVGEVPSTSIGSRTDLGDLGSGQGVERDAAGGPTSDFGAPPPPPREVVQHSAPLAPHVVPAAPFNPLHPGGGIVPGAGFAHSKIVGPPMHPNMPHSAMPLAPHAVPPHFVPPSAHVIPHGPPPPMAPHGHPPPMMHPGAPRPLPPHIAPPPPPPAFSRPFPPAPPSYQGFGGFQRMGEGFRRRYVDEQFPLLQSGAYDSDGGGDGTLSVSSPVTSGASLPVSSQGGSITTDTSGAIQTALQAAQNASLAAQQSAQAAQNASTPSDDGSTSAPPDTQPDDSAAPPDDGGDDGSADVGRDAMTGQSLAHKRISGDYAPGVRRGVRKGMMNG
jgi:hypothetical protein